MGELLSGRAYSSAAVRHEAEYRHPFEHHNPMEMHATTVVWEGGNRITVYEKTQGVLNSRDYVKRLFGFGDEDVRVIAAGRLMDRSERRLCRARRVFEGAPASAGPRTRHVGFRSCGNEAR
jgi:hypothetical protein